MTTIKQTELSAREEPSGGTAMHWIGGQWLDSGEHRESINPATGNVIGSYAKGGRRLRRLRTIPKCRSQIKRQRTYEPHLGDPECRYGDVPILLEVVAKNHSIS